MTFPPVNVLTDDMTRAPKGGVVGLNGEFYEGGMFLPSSARTVKGALKMKPAGKREVAPYDWQYAPEGQDDALPLYAIVSVIGRELDVKRGQTPELRPAPLMLTWPAQAQTEAARLLSLYAAGERWTTEATLTDFLALTGETELDALAASLTRSRHEAVCAMPQNVFVIAALREMGYAHDGGFGGSILRDLQGGTDFFDLSDRAQTIVAEMYAKHYGGRRGSKAYAAAVDRFDLVMDTAAEELDGE